LMTVLRQDHSCDPQTRRLPADPEFPARLASARQIEKRFFIATSLHWPM